ncbi:D-xylose-proton symporter-like 3, chloroplastic [Panicum miliaceum]|uniref:D-xylose-proton symporter-like 3, chloroplastic n=1 Tax=Panicum miliaceum TaxID=4540 RepID=A0A3L6SBM8_PANMI|nr:D-xylose-proton symporter-like 3, chloroplastic [Panicum miliaceum]
MATHCLLPSSLAASTAIRALAAPTCATHTHRPLLCHRRRRPLSLSRRSSAMDALRVTGDAEPLLRPAAGGHPRLRVRRPTLPPGGG